MTDPAIVAAQRAWDARRPIDPASSTTFAHESGIDAFAFVVAAVREALAPIRELHHIVEPNSRYPKCSTCESDWPCATAYLAYTTKELEQ